MVAHDATTLTGLVDACLFPTCRHRTLPFQRYWRKWCGEPRLPLVVPPSAWTRQGRYGIVGTTFDYVVGNAWAKQPLTRVLERAGGPCEPTRWVIPHIHSIITIGPVHRDSESTLRRHRDYYRSLGLLAALDATYRNPMVMPPEWLCSAAPTGLPGLRAMLREHYPVEFVGEIRSLLERARHDLPRAESVIYNPDLSGEYQGIHLKADTDLILGDLLLELKVSAHPKPHLKTVLQLLGYGVLAAHRGVANIKRIGCYNPRFGLLWVERVDRLLLWLGWRSFGGFRAAFDDAVRGGRPG